MKRVMRYLGLFLVALWSLFPLVWQLITFLKPAHELTALPPLLPSQMTVAHYTAVFIGHPFLRVIGNSFMVAACTTLFALLFRSIAAFA